MFFEWNPRLYSDVKTDCKKVYSICPQVLAESFKSTKFCENLNRVSTREASVLHPQHLSKELVLSQNTRFVRLSF